MSTFPSLLQSAEDARRAQLTREECQYTWNPRLSAWLVAHRCGTARERFEASVNHEVRRLVREAEARYKERAAAIEAALKQERYYESPDEDETETYE